MISYKERLNAINTFIFDVDGVLSDGKIYPIGDELVRSLNSKDGYAIQYAVKKGYRVFIITGGNSVAIKNTLLTVGVTEVCLGSSNKLEVYERLKKDYHFSDQQVAYMGDDIPDYIVMQHVGLAACPQDAVPEIKHIAHYQSPKMGGEACVRDLIEQTLRVQNTWFHEEAFHW